MGKFRDRVSADLSAFLNPDEFAEPKQIKFPGFPPITVLAVPDDDANERYPNQAREYRHFDDGAYQNRVTLFVSETDLGFVPEEDALLEYGEVGEAGYPYRVAKVRREMGLLKIQIEANRT